MIWQDLIIAIANLLFTFSLANQVYHGFKVKRGFLLLRTSGLTSLGLYLVGICFFSLSLYFSGIVAITNATLWLTLFIQRLIFKKAK